MDRLRALLRELDLATGVLLPSVVGGAVAGGFWLLGRHWTRQLQEQVRLGEMALENVAALEKEVDALELEKQKDDFLRVKKPLTYIHQQAENAGISAQDVAFTPKKPDVNPQQGFVDEKFSIEIRTAVTRQQASDFLFDIETKTGRFKAPQIRLYPYDERAKEPEDLWKLYVDLALRRP